MQEAPYATRGIANSGNTCYVNSVLQMLFCIPSFRRSVELIKENKDHESKSAAELLSAVFESLMDTNATETEPVVLTEELRDSIRLVMKANAEYAEEGAQADVSEVMIPLLDWVISDSAIPINTKENFCLAVNEMCRCAPTNKDKGPYTKITILRHTIVPGVNPIILDPKTERNLDHARWIDSITRKGNLGTGSKVFIKQGNRYVNGIIICRVGGENSVVTSYKVQTGKGKKTKTFKLAPHELALKRHIVTPSGEAKSTTVQHIINNNAIPLRIEGIESCDGDYTKWEMTTVSELSQFIVIPTARISSIEGVERHVTDVAVTPSKVRLWLTNGTGMVSYMPIGAILFIERLSHYIFVRLSQDGKVDRIYDDSNVVGDASGIGVYKLDVSKQAAVLLYQRTEISHDEKLDKSTWGSLTVRDHRSPKPEPQTFGDIVRFASALLLKRVQ